MRIVVTFVFFIGVITYGVPNTLINVNVIYLELQHKCSRGHDGSTEAQQDHVLTYAHPHEIIGCVVSASACASRVRVRVRVRSV